MGYKVTYFLDHQETGHELISDFEAAKNIADRYAKSNAAHKAEVRDADGALRFHAPRIMRNVQGS
jgi:hypothetical protein